MTVAVKPDPLPPVVATPVYTAVKSSVNVRLAEPSPVGLAESSKVVPFTTLVTVVLGARKPVSPIA